MTDRLIIVSNRLPISVHDEHGALSLSRSNGGLATALASLFHQDSSLWIGWTGLRRHLSNKEVEQLDMPPHLMPVNLTGQEIAHYYDKFSNGILWPLAHGLPATVNFTETLWREAKKVTGKFADAIQRTIQTTDTIWIHDYHLMLLPAELRRRGITNRIGFFLHTPFPPFASVQHLPHLRDLVKSIVAANVIGLQVKRDVERFNEICTALKLPHAAAKSFPIGIDFASFDSLNDDPAVQAMANTFKKQLGGKTIISSLSRLDYTKGILTQLRAFRALIADLPDPQRIVYRLNVAPSRESVLEYRELRSDIEQLVDAINTEFGTASWQPVIYTYDNIGLQELAAWYQISNIHLNVPVADGMNLIAKEYVAARRKPGVLIISGTMGAADQLKEAVIVPPENIAETADALRQALAMPRSDKATRWAALRHNVKTQQVADWAQTFLDELAK